MTDVFDNLLTDECDILKKAQYGTGSDDEFGQPDQSFITIVSAQACRVSTMSSGKEYKTGKESAKNSFKVFMRPVDETDSGVPMEVDTHNWLKITKKNGVALASPFYLNITAANNPSLLDHHLELIGEQVIP